MNTEEGISFSQDSSGIAASLVTGIVFFIVLCIPWIFWRRVLPLIYFPRDINNPIQYTLLSWIPSTWLMRSSKLLRMSGMKAVLYLKWKIHMIYFFIGLTFFGSAILLPVYITQSEASESWFFRTTANALPLNSSYAWATFSFTIITSFLFQLITLRHRQGKKIKKIKKKIIIKKSIEYYFIKNQHQKLGGGYLRTILIKNIPKSITENEEIKETIELLSKKKIELVSLVWKSSKKINIFKNQEKLSKLYIAKKAYEKLMEREQERPFFRPPKGAIPGYLTCVDPIDAIQFFDEKIEKLTKQNEKVREKAKKKKKHLGIAYVVCKSMKDCENIKANWPFHNQQKDIDLQSWNISQWNFEEAKPSSEILWENVGTSPIPRNIKKTISTILIFIAALFWTVPIAFFGNLDNISLIPVIGVYFQDLFNFYPFLYDYISGLLPALLTLLLFAFFPRICFLLSSLENHHHQSALNTSAMEKFWIFVVFNFFIFYLLFASGIDMIQQLYDNPNNFRTAFENLDWNLYGTFYCNFFISMAFFDGILSFIRPFELAKKCFLRVLAIRGSEVQRKIIFEPSDFKFFEGFAKEAVYFGIVLTFTPVVPLVSICAFLAYFMSYFSDKTTIVLCCNFDPGLGGKLLFRFMLFTNISQLLSYLFWIFFFASHGPEEIFYVAIPVYFGLWVFNIGTLWWIVYTAKIPTKKDTELWNFLLDNDNDDNCCEEYSWDFITSPDAVNQPTDRFLILD